MFEWKEAETIGHQLIQLRATVLSTVGTSTRALLLPFFQTWEPFVLFV